MACGCKNKQNNTAATQAVQRPSNPLNNGSVGGTIRRTEKRIIR
jgi:hypothetical protein